ncbi:hypothetical protein VII00023_17214 [Vibrio ichthyoenteri ATCC 700023]|uniref:Uncharacterized protein n=1 Tax=Vibrio ichthyoenteri ATCC 700023 TaxID=870968 RepID=F9S656_9VIBR|nr:hypothetical protein VII00023_17214 [Vibrio ichthyoenteri ATCC 700023]
MSDQTINEESLELLDAIEIGIDLSHYEQDYETSKDD